MNWYNTLGNHDYGYNVSAQIALSDHIPQWNMDHRFYKKDITLNIGYQISVFFLDSNPCVQDYRNDNPDYWDPCSTKYPSCSFYDTNDDFEGKCKFHENIIS